MNLIPSTPKNHRYLSEFSLRHLLYFYIISDATFRRTDLICNLTEIELFNKFKMYDDETIEEALTELVTEKLILRTGISIKVGTYIEGERSLFTGTDETIDEPIDTMLEYANDYVKSVSGISRADAIRVREQLRTYKKLPISKWTIKDLTLFFTTCYAAYFQGSHRELTSVEFGQMKNFAKLYDYTTVVRMITQYIVNNEDYGKSLPTIASMLYKKEELYQNTTGLSQRSATARNKRSTETF